MQNKPLSCSVQVKVLTAVIIEKFRCMLNMYYYLLNLVTNMYIVQFN